MQRHYWWAAYAAFATAAVSVWAYGSYENYHGTIRAAQEHLRATSLLLEQHADRAIQSSDSLLRGVAEVASLGRLDDPDDVRRLHEHLKRATAGNPQVSAVWVLDKAGTNVAESCGHPPRNPGPFAFRDYFQAHAKGVRDLFIGEAEVGGASGRSRFTLSYPILDRSGAFFGVVVAGVVSEYFSDVFRQSGVGTHARLELVRADGEILAQWPTSELPKWQEAMTETRALSRFPVAIRVSTPLSDVLASWSPRNAVTGSIAAGLIALFGFLTWMGARTAAREAAAYASLERTVAQRTTELANAQVVTEALLANLPVGVALLDQTGRFLRRNPEMATYALEKLPSTDTKIADRWHAFGPDGRRLEASDYPGQRALRGERVAPGIEFLFDDGSGRRKWVRVAAAPVELPTGRAAVITCQDIDQLKRAELALAGRLNELDALYATAPVGLCMLDREMRFVRINERLAEINGMSIEEHIGRKLGDILPGIIDGIRPLFEDVLRTGRRITGYEFSGETPAAPGVRRSWRENWAPVLAPDGTIAGVNIAVEETTERRRTERRLDAVLNNTRMGVMMMDDRQHCVFMNTAAEKLTGYTLDETFGRPLHCVVHHTRPDGRPFPLEECPIDRAFPENNQMSGEEVFVHKDGTFYPVAYTASPIRDEGANAIGTVIELRDIRSEKENETRIQTLINELNHRVKNTLATVQAITRQALKGEQVSDRARDAIQSRLAALARSHDLLTRVAWGSAQLDDVVNEALSPFAASFGGRIHVHGDPLLVAPKRALALGMAMHELATNAVKYGALSAPEGEVEVRWLRANDGGVDLEWRETGGPPVSKPQTTGFGSRLIQRALAIELGGEVFLEFEPEGVVCRLHIPSLAEAGQAAA